MHLQRYSKSTRLNLDKYPDFVKKNYNSENNMTNKTIKLPFHCPCNHKICKLGCKMNMKGDNKRKTKDFASQFQQNDD